MASTFKPQDAFDYAKHYVKDMTLEKVAPALLDDVHKAMWMAAPWRWTLGSMPEAALISGTQDYAITVPGDFLFLHDAILTDGATAVQRLKIEPTIPSTLTKGQVTRVAIVGNAYRVSPKPVVTSAPPSIVALYKKTAPTITASNMNTPGIQVFDDEWFWVFREGVLWKAYMYADDARAGGATVTSNGQVQYSGQRGIFEAAMLQMKANEKLPSPTDVVKE